MDLGCGLAEGSEILLFTDSLKIYVLFKHVNPSDKSDLLEMANTI